MIYFDHNATTPLLEPVLEAMLPFLTPLFANPNSLYRAGRVSRSAIETAREQVAALVAVSPKQIIFTSSGTEANNLALTGTGSQNIAISAIEHPSVLEPAFELRRQGCNIEMIGVDANANYLLDDIETACAKGVGFFSLMFANNETGAIQDMANISALLKNHDVVIHTDAVQAAGKIPLDFKQLGVHLMTLSSHKINGPKGCGALVMDNKLSLSPLISGGGQEKGLRSGTENVPAIVGFGKAAELVLAQLQQRMDHVRTLRQRLEIGLASLAGMVIFSKGASRLANTVQFGIPGIDGEMLLMQLDRKGIAVSSGSACTSSGGEASHVLTAMGIEPQLAKSAIRVSLGASNTEREVDQFIGQLKSLVSTP